MMSLVLSAPAPRTNGAGIKVPGKRPPDTPAVAGKPLETERLRRKSLFLARRTPNMPSGDDNSKRMTTLEKLSRRSFLSRASATGVATTAAAVTTSIAAEGVNAQAVDASETRPVPGAIPVALKVNGETHRVRIDP